MYETTKTIYHTVLELQRARQDPFTVLPYSTLNEKFGVQPQAAVPAGKYPELQYIAIGRGGHRGRIAGDGATLVDILQHDIVDAALFEHIPFILRPITDDLDPAKRANYAMRTLIEKNGQSYFAYYLKKLVIPQTYPDIKEITIDQGGSTVETRDYTPTPAQLTPTPQMLSNNQQNLASGKLISVSTTLQISLSADDIQEILDAVVTLYDDVGYATISEMAAVTGYTSVVNTTLGGVAVSYEEAIAAQVANFIPANHDLQFNSDGIDSLFDLGHTSPYLR